MASTSLFNVNRQLTFYGAYHSNKINVLVHIICVPIILWSFQVMASQIPVPSFIPAIDHKFNDYLIFDLNVSAVIAVLYLLYYFILEPTAALLYTPQMVLSLLTATAFSRSSTRIVYAALIHGVCWIAQFLGHGLAEKRAPALLDNLIGAVVLAPFFVHLEVLFKLGYKPQMHKRLRNEIGKEITKVRQIEAEKRRKGL